MAERGISPRVNGQGHLGRSDKKWGDVQTLKINGEPPFSQEERTKLTNIEAEANKYSLPTASADTLGGVKVGAGMSINAGVLTPNLADNAATQTGTSTTSAVTPASLKAYTEWRPSGMKNLLINGNASRLINQRGIQNGDVFTHVGWRYTFDQWCMACDCASVELIKEPDAAGIRILDATGGTYFHPFQQILEMDEDLSGRTFTLTVDFLSNIDSSGSDTVGYIVFHDGPNSTGSVIGQSSGMVPNSPGTRKKASVTATAPSGARSIRISSFLPMADGNYIKYYNIQLEEGPIATPFEQRPIGLELALCQRYYQRIGGEVNIRSLGLGLGGYGNTTITTLSLPFRVPMRAQPTLSLSDADAIKVHDGTSEYATNWVNTYNGTTDSAYIHLNCSGITTPRPVETYILPNKHINLSAEL